MEWRVGEWEHCTATCGSDGVQHRVVSCVWNKHPDIYSNKKQKINSEAALKMQNMILEHKNKYNSTANEDVAVYEYVDPLLCQIELRPVDQRPCNRISCPAYWRAAGWSKVSNSF